MDKGHKKIILKEILMINMYLIFHQANYGVKLKILVM